MQIWQPWQFAAGRWQQAEHLRPLPVGKQDLHQPHSQDTLNNTIWTGHEDGLVTVLQISDQTAHFCKRATAGAGSASTCAAVSSMVVDAWGRCWVGHEDGTVQVLDYATKQQKALHAAEPFAGIKPAPVSAMHSWRGYVFSSEGWCSVRLWDGSSMARITMGDCGCAGSVISLATIENKQLRRLESDTAAPGQGAAVPAGAAGASDVADSSGIMCRLLSGHKHGQIVIWQFTTSLQLIPEAVVGVKQECPVKSLMVFPAQSILLTCNGSSALNIMRLPSAADLRKAAAYTNVSGKVCKPTLDLGCKDLWLHWNPIQRATSLGDVVVTASCSTVRVWSAAQLLADAVSRGFKPGQANKVQPGPPAAAGKAQQPEAMVTCSAGSWSLRVAIDETSNWQDHGTYQLLDCSSGSDGTSAYSTGGYSASIGSSFTSSAARGSLDSTPASSAVLSFASSAPRTGPHAGADAVGQLTKAGGSAQQVLPRLCSERFYPQHIPAELPESLLAAELSAHCGYQFVRVLPDQSLFGSTRAVQVRCNRTNRLRTLLQIPTEQLQRLDSNQRQQLLSELQLASSLHHPHMLQVQEVFVGPLHLHVVLEECSAGRLLDYPAKQADAWGLQPGAEAAASAALSPEYARWFFQQVVLAVHYCMAVGVTALAIEHTMLKVTPSVPQPVVKLVPTQLLAQGLPALVGGGPAGADFTAPELSYPPVSRPQQHQPEHSTSTGAAVVWACGVVLLKLLGSRLQQVLSWGQGQGPASERSNFVLPEGVLQQSSGLATLLQGVLDPDPAQRYTVDQILQDPWFRQQLPPTAADMTARYLAKPSTCKQSAEEMETVMSAATATPAQQLQAAAHAYAACMTLQEPAVQRYQQQQAAALQRLHCSQPHSHTQPHKQQHKQGDATQATAGTKGGNGTIGKVLQQLLLLQLRGMQQAYAQLTPGVLHSARVPYAAAAVSALDPCLQRTLLCALAALAAVRRSSAQQVQAGRQPMQQPTMVQPHCDSRYVLKLLLTLQQSCTHASMLLSSMYELCLDSAHGLEHSISTTQPQESHTADMIFNSMLCMALQLHLPARSAHILQALSVATAAANCIRQIYRRPSLVHVEGLGLGLPCLQRSVAGAMHLRFSAVARRTVARVPAAAGTLLLKLGLPANQATAQGLPVGMAVLMDAAHLLQQHMSRTPSPTTLAVYNSMSEMAAVDLQLLEKQPLSTTSSSMISLVGDQGCQGVQVVGLASLCAASHCEQHAAASSVIEARDSSTDVSHTSSQHRSAGRSSRLVRAAEHPALARGQVFAASSSDTAAQLAAVLQNLQATQAAHTASGCAPVLTPIISMCLDPPLLVVSQPAGNTLDQWISSRVRNISSGAVGATGDFTAAWVQGMPWKVTLQVLSDVAAALATLHQQQPAVVHGGVHAAAVHLTQQLPEGAAAEQQEQAGNTRVAQLSLAGLLSQLSPISSVHPFLCAPEVLLASGPPTPAADVYGFGVLLFQLATGWLPQQYTPGTDEQIHTVMWCRDMMTQAGSMSPLAAAHTLLKQQSSSSKSPATGQWTPYGCHLLSEAALQQLPPGYLTLMEQCLHRVVPARPCMQQVAAVLRSVLGQQLV